MEQDYINTEQQQQGQKQQEATTENNVVFQDQQETNQIEEQVQTIPIYMDCGLMPEFKSADYKSLESIKETFAPLKNINDPNFTIPNLESAIFLKFSSSNKDHLHKAIKYGIWTTVNHQINQIEKIYQESLNNPLAQIYFYFFFENQLYGMAKLKEGFNPNKSFQLWTEEARWFGIFEIEWIFVGKVDVGSENQNQDKSLKFKQEQALKLFEFAKKSDFQTVFNDFESFDLKEKEIRKVREDREGEYYQKFCQTHSQNQFNYEKGIFPDKRNKNYHKGFQHKNNQGYYQHNQNHQNYNHYQSHHYQNSYYNQNIDGNTNNNNNYAMKNMNQHNYQFMTQQQQQQILSIPYIQTPEDFEKFIQSQPKIYFNQNGGFKKHTNKKYFNNNNNQQKGYRFNAKYQNQQKPFNNNDQQLPTDPSSSQSPTVEHQEVNSTEQTQQVEQNTNNQQNQHYHKNYQHHSHYRQNNGYNNQYHYNNNNQQVNGNYNNKFQHYKNYNNNGYYQNNNGNGNYYNNKKYNNRNFKQNNQNRQNRQNIQSQGYQGDQNDFPSINDVQHQNQVDDLTQVEQQMDAINISQQ
ncbi:hypothetical protein TTHERM_00197760 (macronuclear) [Tetrahymena thermophila SB210]|uniref:YTH domain-containing protein n=1 Tax=Tetrahymena thermophila (strain SB210) TaxID=312017 RepID=Q22NS3_TETTS|nr:hypothetical protein TTHERM_00197760 [Tetrahymena thermophila SB210]EAR86712.1 hypothetical protein TTHERM_00197760 [Tetrahymena thermophila SB210]|eukprot:XP_001006957.1 hypothetical protein TTHERM_00197760 [Tetrahymena thermophila SB210]